MSKMKLTGNIWEKSWFGCEANTRELKLAMKLHRPVNRARICYVFL